MAFIGNTNLTQSFAPAIDTFNGDASTVAFTLTRPVISVAQIQVVVENVPQSPNSAFSVSGNTLTFTSAPPSGSSNIYVYYVTTNSQVVGVSQGAVGTSELADGAVTAAKLASSAVTIPKISATGTPSSSTYLRGDGAWASLSVPEVNNDQVFTSSGTFNVPAGVTRVKVTLIGAGGTGAPNTITYTEYVSGGGGGAGGWVVDYVAVTPGGTATVTVGTNAGTRTSSFAGTTTVSASGGSNGAVGTGLNVPGVNGASGAISFFGVTGYATSIIRSTTGTTISGLVSGVAGQASGMCYPHGYGAAGGNGGSIATAAGYGGGGAGGDAAGTYSAGAGGNGLVIVEW
jgi:hypothetical protein